MGIIDYICNNNSNVIYVKDYESIIDDYELYWEN